MSTRTEEARALRADRPMAKRGALSRAGDDTDVERRFHDLNLARERGRSTLAPRSCGDCTPAARHPRDGRSAHVVRESAAAPAPSLSGRAPLLGRHALPALTKTATLLGRHLPPPS